MESIKGLVKCQKIVFEKNGFVIGKFSAAEQTETLPRGWFTIKGDMFVKEGEEYLATGVEDKKSAYDDTYNAIRVAKNVDLTTASKDQVKTFLSSVISESKAVSIVEELDDPIGVLEKRDINALTEVKGIGVATAEKIVDVYFSQKDFSYAYVELGKYGLTTAAIARLCKQFTSPEALVETVKNNPYELTKIDGYGFTKADTIFLNNPKNKPTDMRRVQAYIRYMFEKEYEDGNTWITPTQFVDNLREFIYQVDIKSAIEYINNSKRYTTLTMADGSQRVTTSKMVKMEESVARELNRLLSSETTMKIDDYNHHIEKIEKINGWQYDESQRVAIDGMFKENVYMLQGLGGTGKTTVVKAFSSIVHANGYTISQCCLSGKASDNLAKVTGFEASTIHSLLGYSMEEGKMFQHDKETPLPSNVVVLDELSMVSIDIFLPLLKAIKTGSKLIMIGDYGQLEAIGVGVMGGMIRSKTVPMSLLKKIHRQAMDSAIITHSISVRNGKKPKELKLDTATTAIYGVKNDLEYVLVDDNDEDRIFANTVLKFKEALAKFNIEDIQILCSTRKLTYELNKNAKMVYNPTTADSREIELGFKDNKYNIGVGDKVINMKNNKATKSVDGLNKPIFNGNTGIVKDIQDDGEGNPSLVINFDGMGEIVVEGDALNNIQLGYAITIHKSQGSTIKCVIFALPFHFLLNTKELVYTGMTRASEYQVLVTSPKSFKRALRNTSVEKKQVSLSDLLVKEIKGEEVIKSGL